MVGFFKPEKKMTFGKLYDAFGDSARSCVSMAAACATAGIIIGGIALSGIGGKMTSITLSLTGGNLFLTLFFTAVVCIILGMGMTLPAAYLLTATLMAPAVFSLGVPLGIAHLFIVYFATASAITPPVAVAAYAASGIANVDPSAIGWNACKLGFGMIYLPFYFVYHPQILTMGPFWPIVLFSALATVSLLHIQGGMHGWFFHPVPMLSRLFFVTGGLMMIALNYYIIALGVVLILLGHAVMKLNKSQNFPMEEKKP